MLLDITLPPRLSHNVHIIITHISLSSASLSFKLLSKAAKVVSMGSTVGTVRHPTN